MKEITLTQGKVALVDNEDYKTLSLFTWCVHKERNVYYAITDINGKQLKMHRLIMNTQDGIEIDHRDHNGLNNQKYNLRNCTSSQNAQNRRKRKNCSSVYKGVSFNRRKNKWNAGIKINGKQFHLGYFILEKSAAKAYDLAANKHFKGFANFNILSAKECTILEQLNFKRPQDLIV